MLHDVARVCVRVLLLRLLGGRHVMRFRSRSTCSGPKLSGSPTALDKPEPAEPAVLEGQGQGKATWKKCRISHTKIHNGSNYSQQSLRLVICHIFCLALSDRGKKAWQLHKIDQLVMLLGDPVKSLSWEWRGPPTPLNLRGKRRACLSVCLPSRENHPMYPLVI